MGIQGLLKFLQPVTTKQHISSLSNKTVAIDMMSWLYKGCYRCAYEHNQNIESNNFLYYIFEMLELLGYYKIKPICVFDGRYVGRKEDTLEKRKKSKEENRQKGLDYLSIGNQDQARKYLSRCIIIDERIIATTMRALHSHRVPFMVAPYESDSQIAKLIRLGLADFAITQDSDLVVYGLPVALKLNQDGDCDYIDLSKWTPQDVNSEFLKKFLKFNHVGRLQAAILSGCDYNPSVYGIGIKRAVKHIQKLKDMQRVVEYLRGVKPYSERVPADYQKQILSSKLIFLFATTYNPFTKTLEYLDNAGTESFLGDMTEQALQMVVGRRYDYDQDMRTGLRNVKTGQKREIYQIQLKNAVSINQSSLQNKQLLNRQRRDLQRAAKQRRQEQLRIMAENGTTQIIGVINKKKKITPVVPVLTQEEKKKLSQTRKAQRVKRFNDFKELLNNYIIQSEEESGSQESSEEIMAQDSPEDRKEEKEKGENNKDKQSKQATKQKQSKQTKDKQSKQQQNSTYSDSDSNQGLQYLNPWLKKQL